MFTKVPERLRRFPNGYEGSRRVTKIPEWLRRFPNGYDGFRMATKFPEWLRRFPKGYESLRPVLRRSEGYSRSDHVKLLVSLPVSSHLP